GIVNDIDAAIAGDRLDALAEILGDIVDEMIGPGAFGDGKLLRAARGGDHLGTHRLGDLDGGQADAARGPEYQHTLAGLQMRTPGEGAVRRAVSHGETGGGDKIHAVGNAVKGLRLGHDLLGKAAAADRAEHAVAELEAGDAGTDLGDSARDFHARNERKGRLFLVLPGDDERVGEIEAGGVDRDAQRALAQRRRRHVGENELLRSAEFLAQYSAHSRSSPYLPVAPASVAAGLSSPTSRPATLTIRGRSSGASSISSMPSSAPSRRKIAPSATLAARPAPSSILSATPRPWRGSAAQYMPSAPFLARTVAGARVMISVTKPPVPATIAGAAAMASRMRRAA